MEVVSDIVEGFNRIDWLRDETVSPEAEVLIEEHLHRIRQVMEYIIHNNKISPSAAYSIIQAGGHGTDRYNTLLDQLFQVTFRGVGETRNALILTITSALSWELDPVLGKFENPWESLVKLYEMGYTTTFEEDSSDTIDLVVGLKNGEKLYTIM